MTCYDVAGDPRELILDRLRIVLGGVATTIRNDVTIPESELPLIVLLDGDENAMEETFQRNRPAYGPNIVTLHPEVYITVYAEGGSTVAEWEESVKDAVLTDATLTELALDGGMRFNGSDTVVAAGRRLYGQVSLSFDIDYALRPEVPCVPAVYAPSGSNSRERILQALLSIASQTEGVASAVRNDLSVPEDAELLPRVMILDGGETSDPNGWHRGRPPAFPNFIHMSPGVYIMLREDEDGAGPKLNQVRCMLLRGILTDPTLAGLAADGDIRYEGCQTGLAAGRSLTGEMGFSLSITRVG